MIELTPHARGTVLPVRARPGARKDAIVGVHAGALRVAVSAVPERGKANAAIQDLLASALGVRSSEIDLLSGQSAREKRFLIVGLTPEELRPRLDALCAESE